MDSLSMPLLNLDALAITTHIPTEIIIKIIEFLPKTSPQDIRELWTQQRLVSRLFNDEIEGFFKKTLLPSYKLKIDLYIAPRNLTYYSCAKFDFSRMAPDPNWVVFKHVEGRSNVRQTLKGWYDSHKFVEAGTRRVARAPRELEDHPKLIGSTIWLRPVEDKACLLRPQQIQLKLDFYVHAVNGEIVLPWKQLVAGWFAGRRVGGGGARANEGHPTTMLILDLDF